MMPKIYSRVATTQIINPEYTLPFKPSKKTGDLITSSDFEWCGCTWVWAPITGSFPKPFVLKFPWSGCKHYREING